MFSSRLLHLSLAAVLLISSGCTAWRMPTYDFSRLRDPRAVDIDQRLAAPQADTSSFDE